MRDSLIGGMHSLKKEKNKLVTEKGNQYLNCVNELIL